MGCQMRIFISGESEFNRESLKPVYPDQVHLLTVLHEVPQFGSHLLPHSSQVPEHTKLLEGPVHLTQTEAQVRQTPSSAGSGKTGHDVIPHG